MVETLLQMLRESPGGNTVELSLRLKDGALAVFRGGKTTVGMTPALYRRLTDFLGADSAKVLRAPSPVKPPTGYRRT